MQTACPHCGIDEVLEVLVDAYVVYNFIGFDDMGYPVEETYERESTRTDQFEDVRVNCSACGEAVTAQDFEPAETKPLTIEFDRDAEVLIQHVAKAMYHVTVHIKYRNDPAFETEGYPELALLLTGNDAGITICPRDEMGGPDYENTLEVSYGSIAKLTILGMV